MRPTRRGRNRSVRGPDPTSRESPPDPLRSEGDTPNHPRGGRSNSRRLGTGNRLADFPRNSRNRGWKGREGPVGLREPSWPIRSSLRTRGFPIPTEQEFLRSPTIRVFDSRRNRTVFGQKLAFRSVHPFQVRAVANSGFGVWSFFFQIPGLDPDQFEELIAPKGQPRERQVLLRMDKLQIEIVEEDVPQRERNSEARRGRPSGGSNLSRWLRGDQICQRDIGFD